MKFPSQLTSFICVLAASCLTACSTTNPDVIPRSEVQRLTTVQDAVVLNVREVVIEGEQSGLGAITGGAVGGVSGASVGGHREHVIVGVLGGVAGAVIGNAIERFGTRETAYEILLQFANGERRAIVQGKGKDAFQIGDPVLLVIANGKSRVMKKPPVVTTTTTTTTTTVTTPIVTQPLSSGIPLTPVVKPATPVVPTPTQ